MASTESPPAGVEQVERQKHGATKRQSNGDVERWRQTKVAAWRWKGWRGKVVESEEAKQGAGTRGVEWRLS